MAIETFIKNLNLDEAGVKTLVKAVFLANIMADDLEGDFGSIPEDLDQVLVEVIGAAAASGIYGSEDMEEVLEALNEDEDLENLSTAQRNKVFWEELVSHKVGKEMEKRNIALEDADTIEKLYQEIEEEVDAKGMDNF